MEIVRGMLLVCWPVQGSVVVIGTDIIGAVAVAVAVAAMVVLHGDRRRKTVEGVPSVLEISGRVGGSV